MNERIGADTLFLSHTRDGYAMDSTFAKIVGTPDHYAKFWVTDRLLYTQNRHGVTVLCIPRVKIGQKPLVETVIKLSHTLLGHLGHRKTTEYARRWYWWPTIGRDIEKFCASCGICQTTKTSNQAPPGLLHSLDVPQRPWESIAMDFMGPLPESDGFDYLWVIICHLTSMVHLVPINTTM